MSLDSFEAIALAIGGGVIFLIIVLVTLRRPIGGSRSGHTDGGDGSVYADFGSDGGGGGDGGGGSD